MIKNEIVTCKKCVMDSTGDPDFNINNFGICNYCTEYEEKIKFRILPDDERKKELRNIIRKIRKSNNKYDCLIGVSGGVDSTYVAYLAKEYGLNPLAVHFDNGWNSELAVHNIQKVLEKLEIDYITKVMNWNEFKDLQVSFLKSSTPDGEIPTDHAITATLYNIANKQGIKYILSGNNFKTEGVMPKLWAYGHIDGKYIRNIQRIFGTRKLSDYPFLPIYKFIWYTVLKRIKLVSILNYTDYDNKTAMDILIKKLDWKYYGGKHYESIYTRFYQGYILPKKFNIDKRKIHLSALILSNQLSKQQALSELKEDSYSLKMREDDLNYVLKKLDLSEDEFNTIMNNQNKTFMDYSNSSNFHLKLRKIIAYLRRLKLFYN